MDLKFLRSTKINLVKSACIVLHKEAVEPLATVSAFRWQRQDRVTSNVEGAATQKKIGIQKEINLDDSLYWSLHELLRVMRYNLRTLLDCVRARRGALPTTYHHEYSG